MPYHLDRRIQLFLGTALLILTAHHTRAATRAEELQSSIHAKAGDIAGLEREIAALNKELSATSQVKKTLAGTVAELDKTRKKLTASISLTENQITLANLTIQKLSGQIGNREGELRRARASLSSLLSDLSTREDLSVWELFLSHRKLGESLALVAANESVQDALQVRVAEVKELKGDLEEDKTETESERKKLAALKTQLADQKKIADQNRATEAKLLADTQNKEANYKKLLEEKLAKKAAFEKELAEFQSALTIELNTALLPGRNVLRFPVDSIRLTQEFGDTSFSRTGAYNGKGHNGVDFAAPIGTPLRAARLGTVIGTGDTDTVCPGASYGKWVLIRHDNGISTLYAHLSLIKASEGQSVGTGEVIGYTGNTGYSTGPHLHFTVFATQAVSVGSLKSKVPGCGTYRLPVSAINGYLDPLSYLPNL